MFESVIRLWTLHTTHYTMRPCQGTKSRVRLFLPAFIRKKERIMTIFVMHWENSSSPMHRFCMSLNHRPRLDGDSDSVFWECSMWRSSANVCAANSSYHSSYQRRR